MYDSLQPHFSIKQSVQDQSVHFTKFKTVSFPRKSPSQVAIIYMKPAEEDYPSAPSAKREIGNSMCKWSVTPFEQVLYVPNWEFWNSVISRRGSPKRPASGQRSSLNHPVKVTSARKKNLWLNLCSVALKRVGAGF